VTSKQEIGIIMKKKQIYLSMTAVICFGIIGTACSTFGTTNWSEEERVILNSLWIENIPPLPPDSSNAYADDPRAAELGHKIFFDKRFSSNGRVSCGTCHLPDNLFQDGIPLAFGVGITDRRTMTVIGTAYSPWFFWDGRKDSLWSQALGPLENPVEHGINRTIAAHLIAEFYADEYAAIFGPLPDLTNLPGSAGPAGDPNSIAIWEDITLLEREAITNIFVNLGKSIAAYERLLNPGASRFDQYVEAVLSREKKSTDSILSTKEISGLRLFIGKAQCINCHNGPLFTNNDFHNTGVPAAVGLPEDMGRALGALQVLHDEFNCLSIYSDAQPNQCAELRFLVADGHTLNRQFKTSSLRNVFDRGPYMHAGQFAGLEDVLNHYNSAPDSPGGHSELEPLNLSQKEIGHIIAFLKSLDSPINAQPHWLAPPK
jgi:cytochrome c peroxidase